MAITSGSKILILSSTIDTALVHLKEVGVPEASIKRIAETMGDPILQRNSCDKFSHIYFVRENSNPQDAEQQTRDFFDPEIV
jgi:hypothetical protein